MPRLQEAHAEGAAERAHDGVGNSLVAPVLDRAVHRESGEQPDVPAQGRAFYDRDLGELLGETRRLHRDRMLAGRDATERILPCRIRSRDEGGPCLDVVVHASPLPEPAGLFPDGDHRTGDRLALGVGHGAFDSAARFLHEEADLHGRLRRVLFVEVDEGRGREAGHQGTDRCVFLNTSERDREPERRDRHVLEECEALAGRVDGRSVGERRDRRSREEVPPRPRMARHREARESLRSHR